MAGNVVKELQFHLKKEEVYVRTAGLIARSMNPKAKLGNITEEFAMVGVHMNLTAPDRILKSYIALRQLFEKMDQTPREDKERQIAVTREIIKKFGDMLILMRKDLVDTELTSKNMLETFLYEA